MSSFPGIDEVKKKMENLVNAFSIIEKTFKELLSQGNDETYSTLMSKAIANTLSVALFTITPVDVNETYNKYKPIIEALKDKLDDEKIKESIIVLLTEELVRRVDGEEIIYKAKQVYALSEAVMHKLQQQPVM